MAVTVFIIIIGISLLGLFEIYSKLKIKWSDLYD